MVELAGSSALDTVELGGLEVLLLFVINEALACEEVSLGGLDSLALCDEHMAKQEDHVDWDTNVSGDKVDVVELDAFGVDESVVVLGQADEDAEKQGDTSANHACGRDVGHGAVGQVLGLAGAQEVDVGDEDGDPGEDTKDGGQVDKVAKHLFGVLGDVHKGQAGKQRGGAKRNVGDATAIGALEDGGSGVVGSKTVQGTAGNVQVRVGGREDKDKDTRVDDVREHLDSGNGGGGHKGTGSGRGTLARGLVGVGERGRVPGDNHSDKQDAQAVKDQDTEECKLDGLGDGAARVLRFACSDTNQFSSEVGKGSVDHDGPESQKLASGASAVLLDESSGILPVAETRGLVLVRSTTAGNDQTEENDANDDNDLERRQPEFKLAKELDATKVVDANNGNEENGNKNSRIHFFRLDPELNHQSCGRQLVRGNDEVFEEVAA